MTDESIKQKEVIITLFSLGSSSFQIGGALGLSSRTVEKYVEIYKKEHKAKNVTHLVAISLREKIIT